MSTTEQALFSRNIDKDSSDQEELDYDPDFSSSVILDYLREDPLAIFPIHFGKLNNEDDIESLLSFLANHSYSRTEDNEDEVEFDDDIYCSHLETVLCEMYRSFNYIIQMFLMNIVCNYNQAQTKQYFPQDVDFGKAFETTNGIKLMVKGLIDIDFTTLNVHPSTYTLPQVLDFYNILPDFLKNRLAPEIEKMVSAVYYADTLESNRV